MAWIELQMMRQEPILIREIGSFQLSTEFKKMCLENGFITFGDLLQYDTPQLLTRPGFDYRMLKEIYNFLMILEKQHLLKD